jgi:hypothetical protein
MQRGSNRPPASAYHYVGQLIESIYCYILIPTKLKNKENNSDTGKYIRSQDSQQSVIFYVNFFHKKFEKPSANTNISYVFSCASPNVQIINILSKKTMITKYISISYRMTNQSF